MKKMLSTLTVMAVVFAAAPVFACYTPCAPQPVHCYTAPCISAPVIKAPCISAPAIQAPCVSQCHPRCR